MAAIVLIIAGIAIWVTPVNVLGKNLIPFGCNAPASPASDPLSSYVCRDHIAAAKGSAVALVVAGAVLLLICQLAVPRWGLQSWRLGAAVAAVVAAPALAQSVAALFSVVATQAADGTLIRCGTPLAPAGDAISQRLCAQLPERQRTMSLFATCLSLVVVAGGGYITSNGEGRQGRRRRGPSENSSMGTEPAAQAPPLSSPEVDATRRDSP